MLTKREYCLKILKDSGYKDMESFSDFKENRIMLSSSLAVAAEYLGLIKDPELVQYAECRGGCVFIYKDKNNEHRVFSTRDLLSLLPENEGELSAVDELKKQIQEMQSVIDSLKESKNMIENKN